MSSSPSSPVQGVGVDAFVESKVGVVGVGEGQGRVDVHGDGSGDGRKEEVERLELEVQPKLKLDKVELVETRTMKNEDEKDQKVRGEVKAGVETEVVEVKSGGGEEGGRDIAAQSKGDDAVTPTLALAEKVDTAVAEMRARGGETLGKDDMAVVEKMGERHSPSALTGRPSGLVKAEDDEGR